MSERVEEALRRLGEEHEPPKGWQRRVWRAVAPWRRWPIVLLAAVVAIAIAWAIRAERQADAADARYRSALHSLDYCTSLLSRVDRACLQNPGTCRDDPR